MAEMLMPVPNSPLADDARDFIASGLNGWASDDLTDIAPKTAEALASDGSLEVFVKCLQPRAEATATPNKTIAKAATPAAIEPSKDTAAAAAPEPPLPPSVTDAAAAVVAGSDDAAASGGAKSKKNKNKKKKNKKGGKDSSDKALDATAASDLSVGSSVTTPLAVE